MQEDYAYVCHANIAAATKLGAQMAINNNNSQSLSTAAHNKALSATPYAYSDVIIPNNKLNDHNIYSEISEQEKLKRMSEIQPYGISNGHIGGNHYEIAEGAYSSVNEVPPSSVFKSSRSPPSGDHMYSSVIESASPAALIPGRLPTGGDGEYSTVAPIGTALMPGALPSGGDKRPNNRPAYLLPLGGRERQMAKPAVLPPSQGEVYAISTKHKDFRGNLEQLYSQPQKVGRTPIRSITSEVEIVENDLYA